ncbi:hypothetical protein FA13DRAFT_1717478 [Coprinellus micaceus]|uniref:Uncharacterized protein n=1 Tax=Coprinellus micaceus TaxID=71717 RepID=A0A4Y7SG14_COPMI|nr:hypothetical protein FA13DRAFT_1717478 [Coprinellus micaceus]
MSDPLPLGVLASRTECDAHDVQWGRRNLYLGVRKERHYPDHMNLCGTTPDSRLPPELGRPGYDRRSEVAEQRPVVAGHERGEEGRTRRVRRAMESARCVWRRGGVDVGVGVVVMVVVGVDEGKEREVDVQSRGGAYSVFDGTEGKANDSERDWEGVGSRNGRREGSEDECTRAKETVGGFFFPPELARSKWAGRGLRGENAVRSCVVSAGLALLSFNVTRRSFPGPGDKCTSGDFLERTGWYTDFRGTLDESGKIERGSGAKVTDGSTDFGGCRTPLHQEVEGLLTRQDKVRPDLPDNVWHAWQLIGQPCNLLAWFGDPFTLPMNDKNLSALSPLFWFTERLAVFPVK